MTAIMELFVKLAGARNIQNLLLSGRPSGGEIEVVGRMGGPIGYKDNYTAPVEGAARACAAFSDRPHTDHRGNRNL
jgi:hypothetical protein